VAAWLLLVGVGLLGMPVVSPAASDKASGADSEASKAGADHPSTIKAAEEPRIYADDVLFIQVFDVEQMTREYRVSAAGTLTFPLLPEPVGAAGLTPSELAEAISQKCKEAGVLSHPQITVTIRESRLHSVSISGAVKNPQMFPVFGRISLMDLLMQAGGISDEAGPTVTITRGQVARRVLGLEDAGAPPGGGAQPVPSTVTIDLRRLLENGDASLNVDVYPGDRVVVQRGGIIYVMGAVNRVGGYVLSEARQNMTVLKAIALAGGFNSVAKSKHTMILRPNPAAPSGRDEIPVDLHAMLKGNAPDQLLHNNDILFVPDSTALKALHKSVDVAANTAGMLALYSIIY
jgi:polysaccharide export outer membrane protein